MKKRLIASAIAAVLGSALLAGAATLVPTPPYDPSTSIAIPGLIGAINSGITPQSMATLNHFRNLLDNGDMAVQQRGTGIATCGTATAPVYTAFGADRWVCDVNVVSGAGRSVISTTSPPPGFANWLELYRLSGALTQPVCVAQEVGAQQALAAAGQPVMLSFYAQALAGMIADNGGVINAYVITGTTTAEQGFGSLTASTAITPAWTGIAGGTTPAGTFTLTTAAQRYQLPLPVAIPTGVNQVGVMICFTPTASGAGTTDGFEFTGAQLEVMAPNSTQPSVFEHLPYQTELSQAERYFYQITESAVAATFPVPIVGMAESTSVQYLTMTLPVAMRGTTPVLHITTGTFAEQIATAQTTWVTPTETGTGCSLLACGILTANTTTALSGITVTGAGGSGILAVQSDSIM